MMRESLEKKETIRTKKKQKRRAIPPDSCIDIIWEDGQRGLVLVEYEQKMIPNMCRVCEYQSNVSMDLYFIITQVYKLIAYLPINKKLHPSLKNFP